jgi:hypothetical protein
MIKCLILLLFVLFTTFELQAQDKSSKQEEPEFNKFSIKLSPTQLLWGEVPVIFEYRPHKHIGNELSVGYDFLNFQLNNRRNIFSNGYKARYQLRFYFNESEYRERTWFLGPQVFYKELWSTGLTYNENAVPFSNKSDRPDEYLYNEDRQVLGLELITGFVQKYDHLNIEFYFGAGLRSVASYRTVTFWWTYRDQAVQKQDFTKLPRNQNVFSWAPSVQIGMNLSFPIRKCHKVPSKAKPRW